MIMKKNFMFLAIALCSTFTMMQAQSVLAPNTFVIRYAGMEERWDDNQTTSTGTLTSDGLYLSSPTGMGSWVAFCSIVFTHPLDLSAIWDEMLTIRGKQTGMTGTNGNWRFQLQDPDGSIVTLDSSQKGLAAFTGPDWAIVDFDLSTGWVEGGDVPGFDFSSVLSISFVTVDAWPAHTWTLESIHLGATEIPIEAEVESFTAEGGLTILVTPAAALMGTNAFNFSEGAGYPPVTGVTTTMLNGGAKFNFTGLNINKQYLMSVNDELFYLTAPLNIAKSAIGSAMLNDAPVSVRYYNLQGVEIAAPVKGQAYIAKEVYQSGKVSVKKALK
jgi:hypothetical protein